MFMSDLKEYLLGFTAASLRPELVRGMGELFLETVDWARTKETVLRDNLLQCASVTTLTRLEREFRGRLQTLTPAQLKLLTQGMYEIEIRRTWLIVFREIFPQIELAQTQPGLLLTPLYDYVNAFSYRRSSNNIRRSLPAAVKESSRSPKCLCAACPSTAPSAPSSPQRIPKPTSAPSDRPFSRSWRREDGSDFKLKVLN